MKRSTIPRTSVLVTLGSAILIWLALAVATTAGSVASDMPWLLRGLLVAEAVVVAVVLFGVAVRIGRSREETGEKTKAIPARELVPRRCRRR